MRQVEQLHHLVAAGPVRPGQLSFLLVLCRLLQAENTRLAELGVASSLSVVRI